MREKIMDAAARVFSRKGFYKASMDDITLEAGVAKGTLYYHFQNKSQLFKEVIIDGVNWVCGEISGVLQQQMPIRDMVSAIIEKNVALFYEYPELAHILMNEISNGIDADVLDEVRKAKLRYIEFIAGLLGEGQREGAIRIFDCQLVAGSLLSFIYTYYKLAADKGISDRRKISSEISRVVMNGLMV